MNAAVPAALLARPEAASAPADVAPAPAGVHRAVWHSPFGTIVIEVVGDDVFVNGDRVEPAPAPVR